MRLYESLSYLNNNNNNNHANDNIDRLSSGYNSSNSDSIGNGGFYLNGNSSVNTVKTFTSNGNQQSNIDCLTTTTTKTATTNEYFDSNGSDALNSSQNWRLETEFTKALSALNETYCFYGSHRKLKSREHLDINDDNVNGNDVNSNELIKKDTVDLIDESSSDIEAEINRLISRSNLCRQNFECESQNNITPNTEEQLMDEEGKINRMKKIVLVQ